jgi:predicted dehydrogenase
VARFDNGKWISLNISSIDSNPKNSDRGWLEVTGTKGTYIFDHAEYKIITPMKKGVKTFKGKNPDSEGWRLYQNLADHLVKGEKLVISGEWARRPIHILDLAVKSAAAGKSLKAKYK